MLRHRIAAMAFAASSLSAASGRALAATNLAPLQTGVDYHSFANTEQFRVTRLELDLRVDPFFKVLRGVAGLQVRRLDPNATELILDTRDLNISDVTVKAQDVLGAVSKTETTWVSRPFHFERKDPILGQALVIELPPSKKPTVFVRIDYETSPAAAPLEWLSAKYNGGRRTGVFFTQSEPIGARSWIPLQDTPEIRLTYTATIHTSADVSALMSAKSEPGIKRSGAFKFDMPDAVPAYLIALAAGDFQFKSTGTRTGVYADKSLLKSAAREFADAEPMIAAAEQMVGPYRWGRYDVLVMPQSFPQNAMANPRLTFIAPTAVVGDKSSMSVIAHELAQSWSGHLVSNATWRDWWLSESFAAYLESRIVNTVYGERREMMDRVLGLRSLREDLARLDPADQVLAGDLRSRDPAAADSSVPCEKGRLFLTFLDARFGRERFDAFLRSYVEHFAFTSITTEQFLAYLAQQLLDRYPNNVTHEQVMEWVTAPGLPSYADLPTSSEFARIDVTRDAWLDGNLAAKPIKTETAGWVAQQWRYFLDTMPESLSAHQMARLDQAFDFSKTANAEIGRSWLKLVIRNQYRPAYAQLEQYLQSVGVRHLIAPLYEELMKTPAGMIQAKRVYALARPAYHPLTAAAIDAIVKLNVEDPDEQ